MKVGQSLDSLSQFNLADRIELSLISDTGENRTIAGNIVEPERSLVDIDTTVGMKEVLGERIGLASLLLSVNSEGDIGYIVHQQRLVEGEAFAYYFAQDLVPTGNRDLVAPEQSVTRTGFKIGCVSVNGAIILGSDNPVGNSHNN